MDPRFDKLQISNLYRRAYSGINYSLRTLAGGRFADSCRPTDIGFMMTNLCNARCVHCDIWKNKGRDDSPTVDQYKATLSELRAWLGPVPIYISGGEAMIRPYTTDVVAHASSIGLFAEILTHGYWEDQSRMEKLAMANPGRITVSMDGIGGVHSIVRGRDNFFEKTTRSLATLQRVRQEKRLSFVLRLKTVLMEQNLHDAHNVAHYAVENGMEVFYQAVEQNYNTPEDPRWFEHSDNWPKDPERAVQTVQSLIQLKRQGLPIRNSYAQLEAMIPYFRDPDSLRVSVQSHTAHQKKPLCAALTNMQINPNGDVLACYGMPPVGNIRETPIREIWESRPAWWNQGCCLIRRTTDSEKATRGLVSIGAPGRTDPVPQSTPSAN